MDQNSQHRCIKHCLKRAAKDERIELQTRAVRKLQNLKYRLSLELRDTLDESANCEVASDQLMRLCVAIARHAKTRSPRDILRAGDVKSYLLA